MGSRATYYWIKKGELTISSSKWGAHSVDGQLLRGIEGIRYYFDPPDGSYAYADEIMCEGGVVVDEDRQILRMFGGENVGPCVSLRPAYLALLRLVWPNWDVDWAYDGIEELGEFAFRTHRGAIDKRDYEIMRGVWEKARPIAERSPLYTPELAEGEDVVIVSFLHEGAKWIDYVVPSDNAFEILGLGPDVEHALDPSFRCELPTEEHNWILRGGAIIEKGRRHLAVWFDQPSLIGLHYLAERWAGWTLERQNKGLPWHAERTGRNPEHYRLPLDVAIAKLLAKLDEYRSFRDHPAIREILRGFGAQGAKEAEEAVCLAKYINQPNNAR